MLQKFDPIKKVNGELALSGDKSISHRALMFSGIAKGKSRITNLSKAVDVDSTKKCLMNLGVNILDHSNSLEVEGKGFRGLSKYSDTLDAGNSGTTARLLTGILAGQNFFSDLKGDQSLSKRPMKRIIEPLSLMGVKFVSSTSDYLPFKIIPPLNLNPISYHLHVASAQVKSAILLAGLHCESTTEIIETLRTRNHTELMLELKVIEKDGEKIIKVSKKNYPDPNDYFIPSDISSAVFFIVLTLITKKSELLLKNILLNETRIGILKILQRMGGSIEIMEEKFSGGEKYGNIFVQSSELKNIYIEKEIIPNIIDEIPILSVAGLFADGAFEIRNASELRLKESDRINSLCSNFRSIGLMVDEFEDGFKFEGQIQNRQIVFESYGDHRIAMAFSILSMLMGTGAAVNNFECVRISNPDFIAQIKSIASF